MRVPLILLGLCACGIENDFQTGKPSEGGDDTSPVPEDDTSTTTSDACPEESWDAEYIGIDESCESDPVVGTFTPVIKWRQSSIGDAYASPVVGRIYDENGDGAVTDDDMPAIVVATTAGNVVALSGADGTVLWTVSGLGSEPMTPALGDLTGDGRPEIVASGASETIALRGNGTTLWTGPAASTPACGAVAIGDLDADGTPEVVLGNLILDGTTGTRRGQGAYGSGTGFSGGWAASMGVIADIDGDGVQEAVVGNALYDADGNAIWYNGQTDGFVAVGDFDDDAKGEIVVTGAGHVRLQDDDGTVLWSGTYTGSTTGPPTIADFDGDGSPEIGVAGMGQYMVIDADGTTLWRTTTYDYSSGFTGSAVFDFEGDGKAEVVYADENNVYIYDGATGAVKLQEDEHSSATCSEYPTIADVDNDGHADIIYTSSAYSGSEQGVRVISDRDNSWQPGRPVWNEHAYSITNVNDDVTIPSLPESNWVAGYNNFRSGDITPVTGGGEPDLQVQILDVCVEDCDEGKLTVWLAVANSGTANVTQSFDVELLGESDAGEISLWSETYTDGIDAGYRSASIEVDLDSIPMPLSGLVARVNADGAISDCHSDNDSDSWDKTICPE